METFDVAVIGAGYGGATVTALLAHAGRRVALVEKTSRAGGKTQTLERKGYRYEMFGAVGIPAHGSRFHQLVDLLGETDRVPFVVPEGDAASVWYKAAVRGGGEYSRGQISTRSTTSACSAGFAASGFPNRWSASFASRSTGSTRHVPRPLAMKVLAARAPGVVREQPGQAAAEGASRVRLAVVITGHYRGTGSPDGSGGGTPSSGKALRHTVASHGCRERGNPEGR